MGAVAPFAAMAAIQGIGGLFQAQGINELGKLEESQNNFNARIAELQATDALERGDKDAGRIRRGARQVMGAQRSGAAGQGILVDAGTPGELLDDTRKLSDEDIMTAKNNAWREAFGFKVQAHDYRTAARVARRARKNEAFNTLISGGMGAGLSLAQGYGRR